MIVPRAGAASSWVTTRGNLAAPAFTRRQKFRASMIAMTPFGSLTRKKGAAGNSVSTKTRLPPPPHKGE